MTSKENLSLSSKAETHPQQLPVMRHYAIVGLEECRSGAALAVNGTGRCLALHGAHHRCILRSHWTVGSPALYNLDCSSAQSKQLANLGQKSSFECNIPEQMTRREHTLPWITDDPLPADPRHHPHKACGEYVQVVLYLRTSVSFTR